MIFQASKKLDEKSKSDVLELLGELEGELEAKDIAIATLKVSVILLTFGQLISYFSIFYSDFKTNQNRMGSTKEMGSAKIGYFIKICLKPRIHSAYSRYENLNLKL